MAEFNTLADILETNCRDDRFITYIKSANDERRVSLQALNERAIGILGVLQEHGLKAGDQLIIFVSDNQQFVDVFWACIYGGIVVVPVAIGINDEHRRKLLQIFLRLEHPYLYTHSNHLDLLIECIRAHSVAIEIPVLVAKTIAVDKISNITRAGLRHQAQPGDTVLIQFSSGSTSEPKGIVLSHKNILTNILDIIETAQITAEERYLSWMPLTHDMGLIGFHLNPMALGADHYLMATQLFVRRPLYWLETASRCQVNILCSPNFGYKHYLKAFKKKPSEDLNLSGIRLIFNGAEPISLSLSEQFLNSMAPLGLSANAMYPVYGLAEASLAVAFPRPGSGLQTVSLARRSINLGNPVDFVSAEHEQALTFVSEGRCLPHCEVRLVDSEGRVVGDKVVGRVLIKGDNVTAQYYLNSQQNAALFDENGWLDTGDLGLFNDGELIITGRAKDIIFVNGQNFYPHDLESICEQIDGIDTGKIVAVGAKADDIEQLLLFILHKGALDEFSRTAKAVAKLLNECSGIEVAHIVPVTKIPKTTSGKVQRYLLADAYSNGKFDGVLNDLQNLNEAQQNQDTKLSDSDIINKLSDIFNQVIEYHRVGLDDNLFEIGVSSLALAQIHDGIEAAFPGRIDITDLLDHPTINELAVFIESGGN